MTFKPAFKLSILAFNCIFLAIPIMAKAQDAAIINTEASATEDSFSNEIKIAVISAKPNFTNGLITKKPNELNQLALRFVNFIAETEKAATDEGLSSANNIASFVDNSPSLTKSDTIDGAKALAVISAAKSQEFTQNVKNISNFLGKDVFIQKLKENPELIKTINGYEDAQNRANKSLAKAFNKIEKSSAIIAQAAYDLQKQKWSVIAYDKQPRLEATQIAWNKEINLNDEEFSKLSQFLDIENSDNNSTIVNDKLIIAAAILTIAGEEVAMANLNLNSGKFCANNAYLNLRMCLSATKYPFEHSFCLAKHAYSDFENCAKAATK